jgi:hypothetical protein
MPNPIEPSPMTAIRGFGDVDGDMRRFLEVPLEPQVKMQL